MSGQNSWKPKYDIDEMLKSLDHSGRPKIIPRDYLKLIEGTDKACDLLRTKNGAAHGDVDINTMISQTHGTLSAENIGLTSESGPRVSTEFVEKVIQDKIPIFMDGNFFKLNVRKSKNVAKMNRAITRQ